MKNREKKGWNFLLFSLLFSNVTNYQVNSRNRRRKKNSEWMKWKRKIMPFFISNSKNSTNRKKKNDGTKMKSYFLTCRKWKRPNKFFGRKSKGKKKENTSNQISFISLYVSCLSIAYTGCPSNYGSVFFLHSVIELKNAHFWANFLIFDAEHFRLFKF